MKKNIIILLTAAVFVGCGKDVDIESFMADNELYTSNNEFTKPGEVKNISSTSATICILRQSASQNEYMWVIPSNLWNNYNYISYGLNGVKVQKIPNKTDVEIVFNGLTPATTYYCFQSKYSVDVYTYSLRNYYYYVTFETPE